MKKYILLLLTSICSLHATEKHNKEFSSCEFSIINKEELNRSFFLTKKEQILKHATHYQSSQNKDEALKAIQKIVDQVSKEHQWNNPLNKNFRIEDIKNSDFYIKSDFRKSNWINSECLTSLSTTLSVEVQSIIHHDSGDLRLMHLLLQLGGKILSPESASLFITQIDRKIDGLSDMRLDFQGREKRIQNLQNLKDNLKVLDEAKTIQQNLQATEDLNALEALRQQ